MDLWYDYDEDLKITIDTITFNGKATLQSY